MTQWRGAVRTTFAIGLLMAAGYALGDDEAMGRGTSLLFPDGRHRLDLSTSWFDTAEGDVWLVFPGYSRALGGSLRLGVEAAIARVEDDLTGAPGKSSTSGLGDTSFSMQYAPSTGITASPWIPNTLGLVGVVTAPTGDADRGLSSDSWQALAGLGWSYNLAGDLWVTPSGYYATSFSEGDSAERLNEAGLAAEFTWLFENGVWLGYRVAVRNDRELHKWADDHLIVGGKMFPRGFGISFEYGRLDRLDLTARRDSYTGQVNFYYQFDARPRDG